MIKKVLTCDEDLVQFLFPNLGERDLETEFGIVSSDSCDELVACAVPKTYPCIIVLKIVYDHNDSEYYRGYDYTYIYPSDFS